MDEEKQEKIDHAEELKKINKYLEPGEPVLFIARQSRILPGGAKINPNTIFATDRKLIIRNPTTLGLREEVIQIPYKDITSVELEKGVFTTEIAIMAPGLTSDMNRFLKPTKKGLPGITAIPKDEAVKLFRIIEQGKSGRVTGSNSQVMSVYDELKKLKELLDTGVLTQEEFDAKKKQILARS